MLRGWLMAVAWVFVFRSLPGQSASFPVSIGELPEVYRKRSRVRTDEKKIRNHRQGTCRIGKEKKVFVWGCV